MYVITEWMDENGYITQHPKEGGDAGDTANRHGVYHTFREPVDDYVWGPYEFVKLSGQVVRHPEGKQVWTREEDRSSRDQNIPILCALIKGDNRSALSRIASAVMKNFSRFHNYIHNGRYERKPWYTVDVAGPEIWGLFIRGLGLWPLYPLLWVCDLETLAGTLIWNSRKTTKNNDIPQHLCVVKTINERMPTLIGRLALKLLNKELAILKVKAYYDFPGYSAEPLKDQVPIGEMIIRWLNKQ